MQLTHRYNYERAGSALGQNFVGNPDLVAELPWAFETAGLFWNWNNLNALADANDIVGTTRKINGGQNGIDDRRAKWSSAKSCMQRYPSGGSPPPPTPVPSPVPSGGCRTYTVRSGDSLSAIAARFGTTVVAIARTNGITNVNLIRVGQVLRIC
jgi:nucleoid-associated protein YgaU